MDILDRYLGYEGWTLRHIMSRSGELSREQLHQTFDIGHASLHETINHVITNFEMWTDLIAERPVRDLPPIADNVEDYLRRFDAAMAEFSELASTLAAQNRLDESYLDVLDKPPQPKSFGITILHTLTHATVHRWEMQHILQRLGLDDVIEGDANSWEWRVQNNAL